MSRASDILRERARKADDIIAAYSLMAHVTDNPDELRAIVDLLDSVAALRAYQREGAPEYTDWDVHFDRIMDALAAAERAITGERE